MGLNKSRKKIGCSKYVYIYLPKKGAKYFFRPERKSFDTMLKNLERALWIDILVLEWPPPSSQCTIIHAFENLRKA